MTVLTVTPNPALDTTYSLPALVPGHSHRVEPPVIKAGGKGVNVARVVHQSGNSTHAVLPVGGESGALLRADLAKSGFAHSLVEVAQPTRRSIAIYDGSTASATLLNEIGGELTTADWNNIVEVVGQQLPRSACLAGSGSLPRQAPEDFYARLIQDARSLGIPTIIDTSGPALLHAARAGATVLKPNHHELFEATGETNLERGARMLLDLGAGLVLVSQGDKGMLAFDAREPAFYLHASLPSALEGNPTGAGDAAVAAVAVLLAHTSPDVTNMLRAATAWSASAVLMPTAGVLHEDYHDMADTVVISRHDIACRTPPGSPHDTAPSTSRKDS
ncbi:1-phosphofructokinase family hexose kinase [Arthrobacter sp. CAN_A214]|uniref:1-phosphofructokinase family hexose kinase n=1 Tax=Arthrobacter sp. CAN_A214 TaxID=2787720 RepID=UPI001A188BC4